MKRSLTLSLLAALLVVAAFACDSANPVAPSGTILIISASPTQIELTGTSTVTVTGRRPNGSPLARGTEIRFSTNLGTIDGIVSVDGNGIAVATLQGDGRSGTATVTASTGSGTSGTDGEGGTTGAVSVTVDVQIGESDATKPTLLVSASPDNIAVEGTSTITIIGRKSDGSPVAGGQEVILTTTLGSLDPARPVTQSDGTTTSTLTAGAQAGTATVTAILGASDPATTQVTIRQAATDISIQANPASITTAGGSINLTAFVTNAQGEPNQGSAVTFATQRGTLETEGVVITGSDGAATNTLTVDQNDLNNVTEFKVFARTPNGAGIQIEAEATIKVN